MDNMKMKLLQSLIDSMDESSANDIKGRLAPKMASVDIKSNDPSMANDLAAKITGDGSPMHEGMEMPSIEKSEEPDDDKLKQLMEMYKQMC
jgi:hypothetical protein